MALDPKHRPTGFIEKELFILLFWQQLGKFMPILTLPFSYVASRQYCIEGGKLVCFNG